MKANNGNNGNINLEADPTCETVLGGIEAVAGDEIVETDCGTIVFSDGIFVEDLAHG